MKNETFENAMNKKKEVYGISHGREEVWKINPISVSMACVQHLIWIGYKEKYVSLNNIMTRQEAYEITKIINIEWQVWNN